MLRDGSISLQEKLRNDEKRGYSKIVCMFFWEGTLENNICNPPRIINSAIDAYFSYIKSHPNIMGDIYKILRTTKFTEANKFPPNYIEDIILCIQAEIINIHKQKQARKFNFYNYKKSAEYQLKEVDKIVEKTSGYEDAKRVLLDLKYKSNEITEPLRLASIKAKDKNDANEILKLTLAILTQNI